MALTSSPYGVQFIGEQSGVGRTLRIPNGIANQTNVNIFKYQPVKLLPASGTITAISSASDPLWGIFAGVEYTPLGGRPVVSPFWPAGTTFDPNYDMMVYVWEAWMPGARLQVQADGSVPQSQLGNSFNITNITAGNTSLGLSQCTVGAAGVAAGLQGQLTLIEFAPTATGFIGDAFTDLICTVANPQIGFAPQKSLG